MHELTGREVLGVDAGTQGVSVLLWCPERRLSLGVGVADYEQAYIPDLPHGHLEQFAHYWSNALSLAMRRLRMSLQDQGLVLRTVAGIGITGHMHCMVRRDHLGQKPFGCDMWNDPRGVPESEELTRLFGEHIPGRWTASHILSSLRAEPGVWSRVAGITVTSGSLAHDLSGEWVLGPGDASGMFGSLDAAGQIDRNKLRIMDHAAGTTSPLETLVPLVVPSGQIAARLNATGSQLLGGLPIGTPIAAPEGDQQSVLVGSAADELELALSAGTSFTGNLPCRVGVRAEGEAFNVLSTPDGLTMLMVCVRNGTVGFANYVQGLARLAGCDFSEMADRLTRLAATVQADANAAQLLPFFQGENVVSLPHARASIDQAGIDFVGNPGVLARLLLEAPCLTLRYGLEQLRPKIGAVRRVLLTGGALKSSGGFAPQLFSDALGLPVTARSGDEEGTAKGAAFLAAYMVAIQSDRKPESLAAFARSQIAGQETTWIPRPEYRETGDTRFRDFVSKVDAMKSSA